jgi:hypothetical protein
MKMSFEGTFPVDGFVLSNKRREISKHMLYLSNNCWARKKSCIFWVCYSPFTIIHLFAKW